MPGVRTGSGRRGAWQRPEEPVWTGGWAPAKWLLGRAPLRLSEAVRTHESQEDGAVETPCAHPHTGASLLQPLGRKMESWEHRCPSGASCLGAGRPHMLHLPPFVGVIQLGFGIPAAGWVQVLPHFKLSLSFSTVKWGGAVPVSQGHLSGGTK